MNLPLRLLAILLVALFIFSCQRNTDRQQQSNRSSKAVDAEAQKIFKTPEGKQGSYSTTTVSANEKGNVDLSTAGTLGLTGTAATSDYTIAVGDANGCASGSNSTYSWAYGNGNGYWRGLISSSAAIEKGTDTSQKFIRTAALKFKVKNVATATYAIEKLVKDMNGYVNYTHLNSQVDNTTTIAVSADSSLVTTYYTVTNSMVLRVPDTRLDTTLKQLLPLIDFLDSRDVKAEDVSLKILASRLAQTRAQRSAARLGHDIDTRSGKINSVTEAEDALLNRQEQEDNAHMDALTLLDQIKLSAINVDIYQHPETKCEMVANEKNIDAYKPGFLRQMKEALHASIEALSDLIIFLTRIWYLVVALLIIFILYVRWTGKGKE